MSFSSPHSYPPPERPTASASAGQSALPALHPGHSSPGAEACAALQREDAHRPRCPGHQPSPRPSQPHRPRPADRRGCGSERPPPWHLMKRSPSRQTPLRGHRRGLLLRHSFDETRAHRALVVDEYEPVPGPGIEPVACPGRVVRCRGQLRYAPSTGVVEPIGDVEGRVPAVQARGEPLLRLRRTYAQVLGDLSPFPEAPTGGADVFARGRGPDEPPLTVAPAAVAP